MLEKSTIEHLIVIINIWLAATWSEYHPNETDAYLPIAIIGILMLYAIFLAVRVKRESKN